MERYGVDLARWWRDRRWVALLDFIDQLPAASRLNEAVQNDPEQAELIARARQGTDTSNQPEWSPAVRDFDLHAILMRDLIQAVTANTTVHIAVNSGGKAKQPKPYPRPVTEVDRATGRLERAWTENVLTAFGFTANDL